MTTTLFSDLDDTVPVAPARQQAPAVVQPEFRIHKIAQPETLTTKYRVKVGDDFGATTDVNAAELEETILADWLEEHHPHFYTVDRVVRSFFDTEIHVTVFNPMEKPKKAHRKNAQPIPPTPVTHILVINSVPESKYKTTLTVNRK